MIESIRRFLVKMLVGSRTYIMNATFKDGEFLINSDNAFIYRNFFFNTPKKSLRDKIVSVLKRIRNLLFS